MYRVSFIFLSYLKIKPKFSQVYIFMYKEEEKRNFQNKRNKAQTKSSEYWLRLE
jgi:hypothetical protein